MTSYYSGQFREATSGCKKISSQTGWKKNDKKKFYKHLVIKRFVINGTRAIQQNYTNAEKMKRGAAYYIDI